MGSGQKKSALKNRKFLKTTAPIELADLYRELDLTAGRYVQGGDVIRFIDFLIVATQTGAVSWKTLNYRHTLELKLVFCGNSADQPEEKNLENIWKISLRKFVRDKEILLGLSSISQPYFSLHISNRPPDLPEDAGDWEVPLKKKGDLLSMRLETLWDIVFSRRMGKSLP